MGGQKEEMGAQVGVENHGLAKPWGLWVAASRCVFARTGVWPEGQSQAPEEESINGSWGFFLNCTRS